MALILERRRHIGNDTFPVSIEVANCVDGYFDFSDGTGMLTVEQARMLARTSTDRPLDERLYALRV